MSEIPRSIGQGEFTIFGVTLHCHVLDNGQRIIEAQDIERLFQAMAGPIEKSEDDLERFARWMRGMNP